MTKKKEYIYASKAVKTLSYIGMRLLHFGVILLGFCPVSSRFFVAYVAYFLQFPTLLFRRQKLASYLLSVLHVSS